MDVTAIFIQGESEKQFAATVHQGSDIESCNARSVHCAVEGGCPFSRARVGLLLHFRGDTARKIVGEIDLVDFRFEQDLARRHVEILQDFQNALECLRVGLDDESVIERIGHDPRFRRIALAICLG